MLLAGILLGFVLGLLAGGRLANLAAVRLQWLGLLFAAVAVRFVSEWALVRAIPDIEPLRVPLLAAGYAGLLLALWANRRLPGMAVALVGIGLNAAAILANGGWMPVWEPSLVAAGFGAADLDRLHVLLPGTLDATFLLRAGPIGDVIPLPIPFLRNVLSVGDVVLSFGLAVFVLATLLREPEPEPETDEPAPIAPLGGVGMVRLGRSEVLPEGLRPALRIEAETGLVEAAALAGADPSVSAWVSPARETGLPDLLAATAGLDRATILGGTGLTLPVGSPAARAARPLPRPELVRRTDRIRRHPAIRLALDGRFSALWVAALVSLLGDRVHQVALAFLVLGITGSPLAVGLVFVAATLPNLLLGPIAGTLVDRWDLKRTLVASDLIRAVVVALVPLAASVDIVLVYPLVFVLTCVSIFFRPARAAILPRVVRDDDLLTANSAMWVGETLADVLGYPLAGLFVAFVGAAALPLAFWVDGVSYLASALLVAAIAIPAARGRSAARGDEGSAGFLAELAAGIGFLRHETVLLVNTLQSMAAQLANGALVALAPVYAQRVLVGEGLEPAAAYALLETAIGVGSLVGGVLVGLVGGRLRRGVLVAVGYLAWGLGMSALAFTSSLPAAIVLMGALGVANMVSIIPSQTLFQERTPPELLGRVVGTRFSLVFGVTTLAMAAGGVLGGEIGVPLTIAVLGAVAAAGGLLGLLVPSVRRA